MVVSALGSWKFLIIQSCFMILWGTLNLTAFVNHWDPYPFILLNLALSTQAAYAAPLILMSGRRSEDKQKKMLSDDLKTDIKSGKEIVEILNIVKELKNKQ